MQYNSIPSFHPSAFDGILRRVLWKHETFKWPLHSGCAHFEMFIYVKANGTEMVVIFWKIHLYNTICTTYHTLYPKILGLKTKD